jgi:hypothetical protein
MTIDITSAAAADNGRVKSIITNVFTTNSSNRQFNINKYRHMVYFNFS